MLHPSFAPLSFLLLPSSILSSLLPSLSAPSLFLFLKDLLKNRPKQGGATRLTRQQANEVAAGTKPVSTAYLTSIISCRALQVSMTTVAGVYMEQGTSDPSSLQNSQSFLFYSPSSSVSSFLLHLTMGLKSRSPCYVGHVLSHHAHILVLCCCLRLSLTSQTSFEFAV